MRVMLVLFFVCGCFPQRPALPDGPAEPAGWPTDWNAALGKTVALEGTAFDAKMGALLEGKEGVVWIDGRDAWPDGMHGKPVRVTGRVIVRDDMPAFVQKPGDLPRSGIPVATEAESAKAKRRYLLADARWTGTE